MWNLASEVIVKPISMHQLYCGLQLNQNFNQFLHLYFLQVRYCTYVEPPGKEMEILNIYSTKQFNQNAISKLTLNFKLPQPQNDDSRLLQ